MLKLGGYRAQKWHLGVRPGFHPSYRGFDEYFGLPYSNDMGCMDFAGAGGKGLCQANTSSCKSPPCCGSADRPLTNRSSNCNGNAMPLYHSTEPNCSSAPGASAAQKVADCNSCIIEQPVNGTTLSTRYAEEGAAFIAKYKPAAGSPPPPPFFLYVAFTHMHVPLMHAQQWQHTSTRDNIFGDTLREVDHSVGAIAQSLKDNGVANQTLLFITADNGPWNNKCGLAGSQGPFHGSWCKANRDQLNTSLPCGAGGTGKCLQRQSSLTYLPVSS